MLIKKPSLERIAKRSGVKSLSSDCYPLLYKIMISKMVELSQNILIVNSEGTTKTIMKSNVYDGLHIMGHNIGQSDCVGVKTCAKKKNKKIKVANP
jgi:histone H3/H4